MIATGLAGAIPLAGAEPFPPVFPLSRLFPAAGGDGSEGFVLSGISLYDASGYSVSGAGDVNGDGVDDVIVSAPGADPFGHTYAGESYVVFGSKRGFPAIVPLATLRPGGGGDGSRGFVLAGVEPFDASGISVSGAGDVNNDGIDDVIIGADGDFSNGNGRPGEGYVVFGSRQVFPAVLPLATLFPAQGGDGSRGFVLAGVDRNTYAGRIVSDAGDVNGDGIDDVIVGASDLAVNGRSYAGESFVVFGSTQGFAALLPLRDLLP